MRDFLLVFKTLYKNGHAKQIGVNGKKRLPATLTFVLSSIPLILIICFGLVFFTINVRSIELIRSLMTILVFGSQVAVLFLSISAILNTLYSSRDIATLNSLPLKPSSIFFAKLLIVYLDMLSLSSVIMLPGLLTLAITFNVVNGFIFYGIYPLILLIDIAAPLLPLFIIILFSMPLTYIGTYFKGKSNLKAILSLVIFLVLIAAYMVVIYLINTKTSSDVTISDGTANILGTISLTMYPDYVLVSYALGFEFGKYFGISVAITIGMIIVILLLSTIFYKRINQRHLESNSNDSKKEDLSYKKQNIVFALMSKDIKLIFRNSYMTITSLSNLLLCPIFLVLMYFINTSKGAADQMGDTAYAISNMGYLIMYSMIFVCGTNMLSMIPYTREGEAFVITKTLPINAKDSLLAKLLLSLIFTSLVLFIDILIGIFLYKIDILSILVISLCLILSSIGFSSIQILFDMKYGNIHWITNQDLKQVSGANKGTLISVFSAIIPGVIMFALGFVISSLEPKIGIVLVKVIYCSILFIISILIAIIGIVSLVKKGEYLFSTIGDKKFVKKSKQNIMMRGV